MKTATTEGERGQEFQYSAAERFGQHSPKLHRSLGSRAVSLGTSSFQQNTLVRELIRFLLLFLGDLQIAKNCWWLRMSICIDGAFQLSDREHWTHFVC